jgi:hypothetical protein
LTIDSPTTTSERNRGGQHFAIRTRENHSLAIYQNTRKDALHMSTQLHKLARHEYACTNSRLALKPSRAARRGRGPRNTTPTSFRSVLLDSCSLKEILLPITLDFVTRLPIYASLTLRRLVAQNLPRHAGTRHDHGITLRTRVVCATFTPFVFRNYRVLFHKESTAARFKGPQTAQPAA